MIRQYCEAYNFDKVAFSNKFSYSENGFVARLRLKKLPDKSGVLLQIGNMLKITQRVLTREDEKHLTAYEKGECYYQKADENSCVPIVEAELNFFSENHPDWTKMKLGISLLMYDITAEDLYIVYDGVNFRLVYKGEVINNNMPFGTPVKPLSNTVETDVNYVLCAEFSNDRAEFFRNINEVDRNLNFYTPYGHNNFIGDVVNFYHDGVYHMLYMPDRHHHSNRWGGGGHHFEHMITRDFINWEDVGSIWDVDEQWQSVGTGTMFFQNGKYYSAYGLHTHRTIPVDKTYSGRLDDYFNEHGEAKIVTYDELREKGLYPSGASYSVSVDGVNFTLGQKIFGTCENPSVYSDGKKLFMFGGYGNDSVCRIWESEDIASAWKIIEGLSFEAGESSAMLNTTECPSCFEWNGYKYLIMGVTGFWKTEKGGSEYVECASKGYDVYEGLSVPMVAKINSNRAVIAGWIGGMGWGSMVVHRELVQYEDGYLGMKWIPEMFPKVKNGINCRNELALDKEKSYYFEAELEPSEKEAYCVRLSDDFGNACELKLNLNRCTAQYGSCKSGETASDIPPMHELIKSADKTRFGFHLECDNLPHNCGDFSIAHVRYPNGKIKVKMLIYRFVKNNATVIDTEIAHTRTLITNRSGFFPSKINVDDEFKNAKLYDAEL